MKIKRCDICKTEGKTKRLKRLNGNWLCKECYIQKRKDRREHLKRNILGIRKREDILKELKVKRKQKELEKKSRIKFNDSVPKIKGSKSRTNSNNLHLYLTKEENDFIYIKYKNKGFEYEQIKEKKKEIRNHLETIVKQLREQKKTNEEINIKFKEEFAKLLMQN